MAWHCHELLTERRRRLRRCRLLNFAFSCASAPSTVFYCRRIRISLNVRTNVRAMLSCGRCAAFQELPGVPVLNVEYCVHIQYI